MWEGSVVGIYTAALASAPTVSISEVRAVAGKGLEGDRYFKRVGTYSDKPGPKGAPPAREVTLIEIEAIEALNRDYGIDLKPEESRRNIVTRGVPLSHLVGRQFRVGGVNLRGLRLCEPCAHLERLTARRVLPGLVHRGGLRAEILNDGMIRVGDRVHEP